MKCEIRWWLGWDPSLSGKLGIPTISRGVYPKHHAKYKAFKNMSETIKALEKINPDFLDTLRKVEIKCRR